MRYRILCVGRRARDPLVEAAEEYQKRLSRYVKLDLVRIRDTDAKTERDELLERIKPEEHLVVLDERGIHLDTKGLANIVRMWQNSGIDSIAFSSVEHVTFVVGGADGIHPDIKSRARQTIALSALTLPHRLALVVLLEQLYRAHTILRGEPYHRS